MWWVLEETVCSASLKVYCTIHDLVVPIFRTIHEIYHRNDDQSLQRYIRIFHARWTRRLFISSKHSIQSHVDPELDAERARGGEANRTSPRRSYLILRTRTCKYVQLYLIAFRSPVCFGYTRSCSMFGASSTAYSVEWLLFSYLAYISCCTAFFFLKCMTTWIYTLP